MLEGSASGLVDPTNISAAELVKLGAVDSLFFERAFFPKAFRQPSPPFHREMSALLDSRHRLVNIQVFRGGAKTTKLRAYAAKRIAYGLAHTVLYIGKSEGHAVRSVKWLRRQIEYNRLFADTFKLRPGQKWQDVECEIIHGVDEYPVWIMAMGIGGSVRGVNQDDFRPDLIVVDDVIDEENAATDDQRNKISDLIYGAVKQSLAPASEAPDAKLAMLQTPLNRDDVSSLALKDPEWHSAVYGCWTPSTTDLPLHKQESAWPERWTSETLRKEKAAAIQRNKLSVWLREMECKLVSPETSSFRPEWLKYYDIAPASEDLRVVMVIDPVPPPSEIQIAKGLRKKDFESFAVIGRCRGDFFLLDYSLNRGHNPEWTIMEFFRLALKWHPAKILVESVAYQRTLAWILRRAMEHQQRYFVIHEYDDKRSKYDRIVDGLQGVTSNGHLYVREGHTDFISQFAEYPAVSHDDLIETVAVGVEELGSAAYSGGSGAMVLEDEDEYPPLQMALGAP